MIYINGELVNFIQCFFEVCKIRRDYSQQKIFVAITR